jgi:hypothetical protein
MGVAAALAQKVGRGGVGHIKSEDITSDCNQLPNESQLPSGEGGQAAAVGRVAKYMMKGTSTYGVQLDEGLEAGEEPGWTMSPVLAARWESAIVGVKLSDKYGSFRGVKLKEDYKYEPPDDKEVVCEKCKTMGQWETTYVNARNWLIHCHEKGKQGAG